MKNEINQIKKYIENGQSVTLNGMPGVGISLFLRQLTQEHFAEFYYIDCFALSEKTGNGLIHEISQILELKDKTPSANTIADSLKNKTFTKPVVFLLAGFDKLGKNADKNLFDDLRTIRSINRKKILFVFGVCRRMEAFLPENVMDSEIAMLSTKLYLKPYQEKECKTLLEKYGPFAKNTDTQIKMSGGHFQLLQLLIQTEFPVAPLDDQFIQLCFKNITSHLTSSQKRIIKHIATGKNVSEIDPYLLNIGILNEKSELFSPLFRDFMAKYEPRNIPAKEGVLFRLLKSRLGKMVSKDEIFKVVWSDKVDSAGNWALDSLVYRLRKNPTFKKSGYHIESQKKLGYILTKE